MFVYWRWRIGDRNLVIKPKPNKQKKQTKRETKSGSDIFLKKNLIQLFSYVSSIVTLPFVFKSQQRKTQQ